MSVNVDTVQRVTWGPDGYASFGQRLGAFLLDGLIVGGAVAVLLGILGAILAASEGHPLAVLLFVLGFIAAMVGALAYDAVLVNKRGATIGKRALGIEVRTADGGLPPLGLAIGRTLARAYISGLVFYLGYLWMLWDDQKRTWHDMICKTYVVDRRRVQGVTSGAGGPPYAPGYQAWDAQPQPQWGAQPQPPAPGTAEPAWGTQPQPPGETTPAGQPAPGGDFPSLEGAGTPTQPGAGPADASPGTGAPPATVGGEPQPGRQPEPGAGPEADTPRPEVGEPGGGAATPAPAEAGRDADTLGASAAESPSPDGTRADTPTAGARAEGPEAPVGPDTRPEGERPEGPEAPVGPETPAAEARPEGPPAAEAQADTAPVGGQRDDSRAAGGQEQPTPAAPGQPAARARPGASAGSDPNFVAVDLARLSPESVDWLHQVAAQVDQRLDRVNPDWRQSPQADAARACAFGLLLGRLSATYPHMRADLGRVAETHPSFSTLPGGTRLSTLEQLAGDPAQAVRWLGPLVNVADPGRIRLLVE